MRRLNTVELADLMQCPYCNGQLAAGEHQWSCVACSTQYPVFNGHPVVIRSDNPLFAPTDFTEYSRNSEPRGTRALVGKFVKRLVPSKSLNLARDSIFRKLCSAYLDDEIVVLVVGCGNQSEQLHKYFDRSKVSFVFCDIDKRADVDVFCDAHRLVFGDGVFDGVVTTAVLEHVLYPEKAVSELVRVLKPNGFVYSELPFLQSVHEGAYDFSRFSMSGHRMLLQHFAEEESGMVAGPGTALVWSLAGLARSLFRSPRVSQLLFLSTLCFFFWIKYIDYVVQANPRALDAASSTYFFGRKADRLTSPQSIVEKYRHV